MLKLKLQYFGHLIQRTNSLEKTLMLGKIEDGRRRQWQRMRGLESVIDSTDRNLSKLQEMIKDREAWPAAVHGLQRVGHDWVTALNSSDNPASANYVVICGRCCAQASTQIAPFTFKLTLRCRHCWLSYHIISVFQMERSSTHESSKFPETQIYWKVGPGFAPAFLILGHWWKHSSSRLVWFIYYGQDKKHWPMEDTARQMHAE